jgi:hypothetical protein
MRIIERMLIVAASVAMSTTAHATSQGDARGTRDVTVRDIVEMTRFGTDHQLATDVAAGSSIQFSPDGKKFAVITHRGDLARNTVDYSLLVFRAPNGGVIPRPELVASFSSSSSRPAIAELRWLRGGNSLVFLGERPGLKPQLYRVSTRTKRVVQLTRATTGVLEYAMNADGDAFVFAVAAQLNTGEGQGQASGAFITDQRLYDLYAPRERSPDKLERLFVKTRDFVAPKSVGGPFYSCDADEPGRGMSISPNGEFALVCSFALSPPSSWAQYRPGFKTLPLTAEGTLRNPYRCPVQILLVDLGATKAEPLINAPAVRASEGAPLFRWTATNSALLLNTFLPLDGERRGEKLDRHEDVYAAEISIPDRRILEIAGQGMPFHAFHLETGGRADEFVTDPINASWGPPLVLRRGSTGWKVSTASIGSVEELGVAIKQGMNEPPTLVARAKGRNGAEILDPNPAFSQLRFGRVRSFHWTMHSGDKMEGALYYPPDYVAGRRYPLVVQTHGYSRDQFWPDGPFTTAYAAQPLASRGFLVLQIPNANRYSDALTMAKEGALFGTAGESGYDEDQIESAVEELDRRGLVDTDRIALSGFSRTVYQVLYTLTHPHFHYAAAVVADGVNFGFADCMFAMSEVDKKSLCEPMNGGKPPFGAGLAGWQEEAPDFRLDKVEAPVLLQAISDPMGEWEILSGLRWLKKPVEMINFYPNGEHELAQPRQVYLSEQSVVDWYSFWLQGYEDSDPAKAEQYTRWEKLCHLQRQQNPHDPSYCLTSSTHTSPVLTSRSGAAASQRAPKSN